MIVHIVINVQQGGGISKFISKESMENIYLVDHRAEIWLTIPICIATVFH
jgi:hypothetical protein